MVTEELKAEAATDIDKLSFREALKELEGVVASLESGTLELEKSLELYSRGVSLLSALQSRLNHAEQKIEVLMGELNESVDDETADTTLQKA